jgi:molybdopterin synthase sulfur carrier subunit
MLVGAGYYSVSVSAIYKFYDPRLAGIFYFINTADLVYFHWNALLEGMVEMDVNFYATLRAIVGKKTVHVNLPPNTTALQLVEMVSADYPALRAELLDAQNRFQRHMKMFINGREAIYLDQQFATIIEPNDKVDIFPPVGGG